MNEQATGRKVPARASSGRMARLSGLFVLALLVIAGITLNRPGTGAAVAAPLDPSLRTIVLVSKDGEIPALRAGDIAVTLEQGTAPQGITRATVLTDENCAPDGEGVSHCLNRMQAGGQHFTIRHNHKMMEEPCFSPTEELNVLDVTTYKGLSS
ncbi:MAG TPA: hypothetical protein VEZ12_08795 [Herpetosiphonaceae bacterium]|nr:hypothetical protein [Herpetosiphonaceae bacterium]